MFRCLGRLLLGFFLISLLLTALPAVISGLTRGVADAGKQVSADIGNSTSGWIKQQIQKVRSVFGDPREGAPESLEKVINANQENLANYRYCLGDAAQRLGVDASACESPSQAGRREACAESAVRQAHGPANEDVAMVDITRCATYTTLDKGGGKLWGAGSDWIRCALPFMCKEPDLGTASYFKCLADATVQLNTRPAYCATLTQDPAAWRMCMETNLRERAVGDLGQRSVQVCRDKQRD